MPTFIIAGSTITAAISPGCFANAFSAAARSLNGITEVSSTTAAGMPSLCGIDAGASAGPIWSGGGSTDTINASWWPWYEASIFSSRSRPVNPRAMRTASSVDSVPEFVKRH